MTVDSKALMNKFIDTHPEFMKTWPLKTRMGFRNLCDHAQVKEFFDGFLKWYNAELEKKIDVAIEKCDGAYACPITAKLNEE